MRNLKCLTLNLDENNNLNNKLEFVAPLLGYLNQLEYFSL